MKLGYEIGLRLRLKKYNVEEGMVKKFSSFEYIETF